VEGTEGQDASLQDAAVHDRVRFRVDLLDLWFELPRAGAQHGRELLVLYDPLPYVPTVCREASEREEA